MFTRRMLSRNFRLRLRDEHPCQHHRVPSLAHLLTDPQLPNPNVIVATSHGFAARKACTADRLMHSGQASIYDTAVRKGVAVRVTKLTQWMAFSNFGHSGFSGLQRHTFKGYNSRYYSGGTNLFTPGGVVWTLIGVNAIVYFMWQRFDQRFMERHFTVSISSVLNGRIHTMLTSAFSQMDLDHLMSNMIGLYFFGSEIGRIFGGQYLLKCYLAGAIGGTLGHMFYFAYIYPWIQGIPRRYYNVQYSPRALGASGAVTTIMLLHIFLYPKHTIMFQMLIPMPAALLGAIIIGRNLWLAKQGDTDISVGGHLGGALVAFLAYLSIRRPWF